MSAFRGRCNFPALMSAFGGKADVLAHLSECLLIAEAVEKVVAQADF
jgi:hypothetical protein